MQLTHQFCKPAPAIELQLMNWDIKTNVVVDWLVGLGRVYRDYWFVLLMVGEPAPTGDRIF